MKDYRPRFYTDKLRWRAVIETLKEQGIDHAEKLLFTKPDDSKNIIETVNGDNHEICAQSFTIQTIGDLIRECKIDTERFEIYSHQVKKWSVTAKIDNGLVTRDMYAVTAKMKPRVDDAAERIKRITSKMTKELKSISRIHAPAIIKSKGNQLCVPMITDLHIGKLGFNASGELIYDKNKAIQLYDDVISDLIDRIDTDRIERIVLPTGNDLINIDSGANGTTRGTPQMTGDLFECLVADAEVMLIRNIERLSKIAPVDVVMIPGNHDKNTVFHIGRTVDAYFHKHQNINIVNSHRTRHYYKYHRIMLGFAHGNGLKLNELPAIAATESPSIWGETRTREFHVGHFHHLNAKSHIVQSDAKRMKGMTVRICPTLTGSDRWHFENGFIGSLKRAESFLYSRNKLEQIMYYNI